MKLTTLILLTTVLQVSARTGFSQDKITLSERNATLETVLLRIGEQTGYQYVFRAAKAKDAKVSVEVKDASLLETLGECFKGQPFTWVIDGKTIVVKEREEVVKAVSAPVGATVKVTGVVFNEAGQPLSGANVTVKETNKGTIANVKGEFELNLVPVGGTLVISYIGYANQEIKVKDATNARVYLKVAKNELDKVVIQAYGTTSQRLTTSDIGTVTAEEIERQPVMNPLLALQGKVAGLDVTQTSGYASAPIKVELRGRNSISSSFTSDPLYIIDGVPLTVLDPGGQSSYQNGSVGFDQTGQSPSNGQSPLFSINPTDIESIAVLKDADATAIYGSRGANGVILITTKKGRAGKTKFDLRLQEGVNRVTRFWNMMNTTQYLAMRREAFTNDGITPDPVGDYDVNGTWDTTRNANWQKIIWGGVGKTIDAQASLSGGDARTTFRLSTGFNHTYGITTISGGDQRASFSLNLMHRSLDQRLSFSSTSSYSYTRSDMINLPGIVTMAPNAPSIYDSIGNLNYNGWGGGILDNAQARQAFPFNNIKQPYTSKTNFLNSNLIISYEYIKGLKLSINLGYNIAQGNQVKLFPISSFDPELSPQGRLFLGTSTNKNLIAEPQLGYHAQISRGQLDLLLGGSYSQANTDGLNITGYGYTSDNLLTNIASASRISSNENYGEYRYAALFGRITYNLKHKYILNLNARRDGSSRFGPGKQYGNFGSVGAAWIFTEESWLKDLPKFLSYGKLRVTYGITGSDAIGDYGYLSQYTSTNNFTYTGSTSLIPIQNPNPNFQWQVTKKLESAINLGFFKDILIMQLAFYINRCGNQLIQFPTPIFTGFPSVPANSPALVQNSGWEFTATAKIIDTKKFNVSVSFNGAINKNKLVAYPDFNQSPYIGRLSIGKPLNITSVLHYTGVDPQTGQYSFYDKNHDGIISFDPYNINSNPPDDSYYVNLSPKFFGGLGINFTYASMQINIFFNIKEQIGSNAFPSGVIPGSINQNVSAIIIGKEWKKPGDVVSVGRYTTIPRNSDYFISGGSDAEFTNASFIRLSNLALSYRLPNHYLRKLGLQSCSLFFNTNNLFLITKYKGIDPETQNFGGLPPVKTIVGGINFNF